MYEARIEEACSRPELNPRIYLLVVLAVVALWQSTGSSNLFLFQFKLSMATETPNHDVLHHSPIKHAYTMRLTDSGQNIQKITQMMS